MFHLGVGRTRSFKGYILFHLTYIGIYLIDKLFYNGRLKFPIDDFEENPLYYKFPSKEIFHFAYKYYVGHVKEEIPVINSTLSDHEVIPLEDEMIGEISFHAGGDLLPYAKFTKQTCENLWDEIGSDFFCGDIVYANLETPINLSHPRVNCPEMMVGKILFNGDPEIFDIFNGNNEYKGFDILSTANNHAFDQGTSGVISTIKFLESKQIISVGTSIEKGVEKRVKIIEKNGIKVGFLSYTYSLNGEVVPLDQTNLINHIRLNANNFDLSKIKEEVVFLKSVGVDFIVGLFHYGLAYQFFPAPHIKENTYRIFEETGIDLIIGNHAHNIQPVEKYKYYCPLERREKCSWVAYALGDFIGDDIFDWCTMSMYLKINIVKYKTKDSVETRIKIIEPKIIIRTEDKSSGKLKLCFAEDVFMHGPKKYNFKNLHIQNYNSNKSLYTRFKNMYTTHQ